PLPCLGCKRQVSHWASPFLPVATDFWETIQASLRWPRPWVFPPSRCSARLTQGFGGIEGRDWIRSDRSSGADARHDRRSKCAANGCVFRFRLTSCSMPYVNPFGGSRRVLPPDHRYARVQRILAALGKTRGPLHVEP